MERLLAHLEPKNVFHFYEDVLTIPHESGNEKELSDYCVKFAKERGLKVIQDEVNNIIIEKPATPGYEDRPGIILQGHLDMVCVAEPGVEIDFAKDPIPMYIDGDYIRAHGTTLGSDDGHAIALCLAILDDNSLKHPKLQVLFTVEEETTFAGAENVDGQLLDGKYYIGLDFYDDEIILASCGGSSENGAVIETGKSKLESIDDYTFLRLQLSDATSGHSALEIHKYSINAIKVAGDLLCLLNESFDIELINIEGGNQTNVIAKWANADFCCPKAQEADVRAFIENFAVIMDKKYRETDPDFKLKVLNLEIDPCSDVYVLDAKDTILKLLDVHPNGVVTWVNPAENIVESSLNIGNIRTYEDKVIISSLLRSNIDHFHDELIRKVKTLIEMAGAKHTIDAKACSWEYNPDSKLQTQAVEIYEKMFGYKPVIELAHGQVETGTIIQKMQECGKHIEAIGIGPTSNGAHTTSEDLYIPSMKKMYDYLCTMLAELK